MVKIREEFKNAVIAFGGRGVPLSDRTEIELVDLGIIAISSGDKTILQLFEILPSIDELKLRKMEIIIDANQKANSNSKKTSAEAGTKIGNKKINTR